MGWLILLCLVIRIPIHHERPRSASLDDIIDFGFTLWDFDFFSIKVQIFAVILILCYALFVLYAFTCRGGKISKSFLTLNRTHKSPRSPPTNLHINQATEVEKGLLIGTLVCIL